MKQISVFSLRITALTTGRSAVFMDLKTGEQYYATRRVTNEILNAQNEQKDIPVWVQKVEKSSYEDRPLKPYEKMNWLATPSRF